MYGSLKPSGLPSPSEYEETHKREGYVKKKNRKRPPKAHQTRPDSNSEYVQMWRKESKRGRKSELPYENAPPPPPPEEQPLDLTIETRPIYEICGCLRGRHTCRFNLMPREIQTPAPTTTSSNVIVIPQPQITTAAPITPESAIRVTPQIQLTTQSPKIRITPQTQLTTRGSHARLPNVKLIPQHQLTSTTHSAPRPKVRVIPQTQLTTPSTTTSPKVIVMPQPQLSIAPSSSTAIAKYSFDNLQMVPVVRNPTHQPTYPETIRRYSSFEAGTSGKRKYTFSDFAQAAPSTRTLDSRQPRPSKSLTDVRGTRTSRWSDNVAEPTTVKFTDVKKSTPSTKYLDIIHTGPSHKMAKMSPKKPSPKYSDVQAGPSRFTSAAQSRLSRYRDLMEAGPSTRYDDINEPGPSTRYPGEQRTTYPSTYPTSSAEIYPTTYGQYEDAFYAGLYGLYGQRQERRTSPERNYPPFTSSETPLPWETATSDNLNEVAAKLRSLEDMHTYAGSNQSSYYAASRVSELPVVPKSSKKTASCTITSGAYYRELFIEEQQRAARMSEANHHETNQNNSVTIIRPPAIYNEYRRWLINREYNIQKANHFTMRTVYNNARIPCHQNSTIRAPANVPLSNHNKTQYRLLFKPINSDNSTSYKTSLVKKPEIIASTTDTCKLKPTSCQLLRQQLPLAPKNLYNKENAKTLQIKNASNVQTKVINCKSYSMPKRHKPNVLTTQISDSCKNDHITNTGQSASASMFSALAHESNLNCEFPNPALRSSSTSNNDSTNLIQKISTAYSVMKQTNHCKQIIASTTQTALSKTVKLKTEEIQKLMKTNTKKTTKTTTKSNTPKRKYTKRNPNDQKPNTDLKNKRLHARNNKITRLETRNAVKSILDKPSTKKYPTDNKNNIKIIKDICLSHKNFQKSTNENLIDDRKINNNKNTLNIERKKESIVVEESNKKFKCALSKDLQKLQESCSAIQPLNTPACNETERDDTDSATRESPEKESSLRTYFQNFLSDNDIADSSESKVEQAVKTFRCYVVPPERFNFITFNLKFLEFVKGLNWGFLRLLQVLQRRYGVHQQTDAQIYTDVLNREFDLLQRAKHSQQSSTPTSALSNLDLYGITGFDFGSSGSRKAGPSPPSSDDADIDVENYSELVATQQALLNEGNANLKLHISELQDDANKATDTGAFLFPIVETFDDKPNTGVQGEVSAATLDNSGSEISVDKEDTTLQESIANIAISDEPNTDVQRKESVATLENSGSEISVDKEDTTLQESIAKIVLTDEPNTGLQEQESVANLQKSVSEISLNKEDKIPEEENVIAEVPIQIGEPCVELPTEEIPILEERVEEGGGEKKTEEEKTPDAYKG